MKVKVTGGSIGIVIHDPFRLILLLCFDSFPLFLLFSMGSTMSEREGERK
jgi:hypothetical protein